MSIIRRGEKTFLVRVYLRRDPLTKRRIEINETVRGSLSYAKKREAKLKEQKYSGRLHKSSQMTVNALHALFLDTIRYTVGPSTYANYESFYNRYARPYVGHTAISQIKPSDIQKLFNFLRDEKETASTVKVDEKISYGLGLSPASVKVVRNSLTGAFNLAVSDGLIAVNPVSSVRVRVPKTFSATSLTVEEAEAFVSAKERHWYGTAFVLQLHTGLRNQELMALIWDDVDFDKGTLRIERTCKWVRHACVEIGRTKTARSNRVITLEAEHLALLRLHLIRQQEIIEERKESGCWYGDDKIDKWLRVERPRQAHLYTRTNLIFPKIDGEVPSRDAVNKQFRRMLRSAGLQDGGKKIRWYDLRHTHASVLMDAGGSVAEIAARMGHSVAILLERYTHSLRDNSKRPSRIFIDLIPT